MIKTKIICTMGPASRDPEMLARLMEAGMNVCRLNFSHGTHEGHAAMIRDIRAVSERLGKPVAILQDLAGPKIRTGPMAAGEVELVEGAKLVLTNRDVPGDVNEVGLTYPDLPGSVQAGDIILLADGAMGLEVESSDATDIRCRVVTGGRLGSHKGINLPGRTLNAPVLGAKDRADLEFGLAQGVDFVALSFVRTARDVETAKEAIRKAGCDTPLIAKIEKFEALENIDAIIAAADGVMVARGDLGVEIPLEQVPRAQKMIIAKVNTAAKPVITATQMLKSMVEAPRPTRAEVTDVANAIYDGTDAIMLSEETAMGRYPVEAVEVMSRVAADTEQQFDYEGWTEKYAHSEHRLSYGDAVAHAAVKMAEDIEAAAILTCTRSGGTTLRVARHRPRQVVLSLTPERTTALRMALTFGAVPVYIDLAQTVEDLEKMALEKALAGGFVGPGDPVVLTAGVPFADKLATNMIKVVTA
ncbi:pyruvate kinase [bacterium CG17_big_fil_post_rev_8_21_14_2_50_64_8]|nr:MAG: pyruvate kinase [bacterium CG17_big_fil_post_rev_8_21_14_2_50_64_8]PJA73851.1 MAG: pyruvate kinase [bacterium CG_4_9_14_3_um_filter_65_15]